MLTDHTNVMVKKKDCQIRHLPLDKSHFITEKGTTQEYLDSMLASTDWIVLVTMLIGTIVIALFSGFVGSKLLKKQFEKAGITA